MLTPRIYLDHNATSPLRPEVRETLARFSSDPMSNPSSIHGAGRKARRALDEAREEVARFIGANPSEIIFNSGGTESNQLAWNSFARSGVGILTSQIEHASVLGAAGTASRADAKVDYVTSPDLPAEASNGYTFVSFQHANNETGVVYNVEKISKALRSKNLTFHSDAVQTAGKMDLDVNSLGVDLLSLSGHKLGALSGIGALYVRRGTNFEPIWEGGPQEKGRRAGTENVLGILSLARACQAIRAHGDTERLQIKKLRDGFETELLSLVPNCEVTCRTFERTPNTSHFTFEGVDGESLLIAADLEGLDCSTGAACSSGSLKPSHVLLAMGFSLEKAQSSLRFSLGWNTTESDIDRALEILPKLVAQVRKAGQNYTQRKAV